MLWLAGLMGLTGIGLVALVLPQILNETNMRTDGVAIDEYQQPESRDFIAALDFTTPSSDTIDVVYDAEYDDFDTTTDIARTAPPLMLTPDMSASVKTTMSADFWNSAKDPVTLTDYEPDVDAIPLSDWLVAGAPREPIDYNPDQDSLVVVWDDISQDPQEPEVDVVADDYDPDVRHVTLNGFSVAEIYGDTDFNVSDLTIIPLSSALIAGLSPGVTLANKVKEPPRLN